MTDEPVVDVVVATHRTSPFLHAALDSVVAQTYPYWTLTVVDDGSSDPTFVPRAVRDVPRAQVIRHANRGLGASRNVGIAAGHAPLIAFLDDDDVWAPTKLEAQVDTLRRDVDAVGSFTGGWYLDQHGVSAGWGWSASAAPSTDFLRGAQPLPRIVTLLIRRTALDTIHGFDPSLTMAEDLEFTLRLAEAGSLTCVPEQLTGYRRHGSNMTEVDLVVLRRASERILRMVLDAAARRGDSATRALLEENLSRHRDQWSDDCARSAAAALRRGDLRTFAGEASWAVTTAPRATAAAAATKVRAALHARRHESG